jgi:hypothetical protein
VGDLVWVGARLTLLSEPALDGTVPFSLSLLKGGNLEYVLAILAVLIPGGAAFARVVVGFTRTEEGLKTLRSALTGVEDKLNRMMAVQVSQRVVLRQTKTELESMSDRLRILERKGDHK